MTEGIERGVSGLRIGLDERYVTADVDPELAAAVLAGVRVLEGLGAKIVEVRMPDHAGGAVGDHHPDHGRQPQAVLRGPVVRETY